MGYFEDRKRFIAASNVYESWNDDLPCGCSPGFCSCDEYELAAMELELERLECDATGYDQIIGEG